MPDLPPARRLWQLLEPLHAVTYFSPEPLAALSDAGFRGFWMGYFAGRAAPLGAAGPDVVHALFYNFSTDHVARALPDAWDFGTPQTALEARLRGSVLALERILPPDSGGQVARAAELARRAAESAPSEGRTLYAANTALPWPERPLEQLWHATTLLREHRGDGHVAALLAHGIGGRESHVLRAAAADIPRAAYTRARNFTDEEWAECTRSLAARGLLDPDGRLTPEGRALEARIETVTDELAAPAYDVLGPDGVAELGALLEPMTAAVAASGDLPVATPIGLRLDRR